MSKQKTQHGFTIVELLFSTSIFSVILLLSLAALVQIGKLYYKGVTTAQTQQTTRNVMDEISQALQLSAGGVLFPAPPAGPNIAVPSSDPEQNAKGYFCLGDTRYTYVLDREQEDSSPTAQDKEIKHVLWADKVTNCSSIASPISPAIDLTKAYPGGTNGRELLGAHMRLLKLNITNPVASATGVWQVDLMIGYGDEDLYTIQSGRKYCKTAQAGTQFCATSELNTIINRRVVVL